MTETKTQPIPAETHTDLEYGVRRPNGEYVWGTQNIGGGDHYFASLSDEATKNRYIAALQKAAKHLGIDPDEYVAGHQLVCRQIITIKTEPMVVL